MNLAHTECWSAKIVGPNEILIKNNVGPKQIFVKKMFVQNMWIKECWSKKCFVRKMLVLKHVGKNVLVQERLCQKKGGPTIIEAEKLVQKVSSVFYSSNFYMQNIANAAMKHFRALKVQTKGNKARLWSPQERL